MYVWSVYDYESLSTHDLTRRSTLMQDHMFLHPDLSTHDLTRRSTDEVRKEIMQEHLSTHDLTRRSTHSLYFSAPIILLSTHDLTRRSTLFKFGRDWANYTFNSRPHTEVDRRKVKPCTTQFLSTHDLTRRSTRNSDIYIM